MTITNYQKARSQALLILDQWDAHNKARIADIAAIAIKTVALLLPKGMPLDIDEAKLIRELESMIAWNVGQEFVLDDDTGHEQWLPAQLGTIEWKFWKRYRRYLAEKPNPLPAKMINSVDEITDKILGRIEDPNRSGAWDRRGMIAGHVQSGKTSNFVGLVCKAADAGYRIIIVLAGLHDNLRSQTQMRVDEGFLGYSAAKATKFDQGNDRIGVGTLTTDYRAVAHSLTGYKQDFSRKIALQLNIDPHGQDPVILVVKKNKTILTNVIKWLASNAQNDPDNPSRKIPLNVPLLVIDDEADHGSINTKAIPTNPMDGTPLDDYEVTAINAKIRQILSLFSRKAYIGYSATPYANLFIRPDDNSGSGNIGRPPNEIEIPYGEGLFPRSFIISLPTPTSYVGPTQVFGIEADLEAGIPLKLEPLPIICKVTDSGTHIPAGHIKDFVPTELPDSLKHAIRCFVLSCAVRAFRGDEKEHKSMLVHVTRFNSVQDLITKLVQDELTDITNRLRYGDGASSAQILKEFESLWNDEFLPTTAAVRKAVADSQITEASWNDIRPLLVPAALKILIKQINGKSDDLLDYQNSRNGASVIAVGGDKLSRGLTLEGLSVSYFLRPSRMYDTLMQMGRWFGYRAGYLDVCRLFTPPDLIDWYKHIAFAAEELRHEFELMGDRTPKEYGLKVRSHPNGLWITSLVKMRDSRTLKISYDGQICETTVFQRDEKTALQNIDATKHLLSSLGSPDSSSSLTWSKVKASEIIAFLREYITHPHAPKVNSALLAHYIARKAQDKFLTNWIVVLVSSGLKGATKSDALGYPANLIFRDNKTSDTNLLKYTIQRLLSPSDEEYGLNDEAIANALRETKTAWAIRPADKRAATEPKTPSGPALRNQRSLQQGLLLLYPLDSRLAELSYDIPTIGIGISFPGDKLNPTDGVEYEANMVYIGNQLDEEEEN
jgi:hypothetical protein